MADVFAEQLPFLDKTIEIQGYQYELTRPLTDFRSCHDGQPQESRIVFVSKRPNDDDEYVIKVKVQEPSFMSDLSRSEQVAAGPSTTTIAELKALEQLDSCPYTPRLVAWGKTVQPANGLLPGGYVSYIVMTKLAGQMLHDFRYLEMMRENKPETLGLRRLICDRFLVALRSIYSHGVEPIDRGLRNILWDPSTQTCNIVDFEVWRETDPSAVQSATKAAPTSMDAPAADLTDEQELLRWGLAQRPPPKDAFEAWGRLWRS